MVGPTKTPCAFGCWGDQAGRPNAADDLFECFRNFEHSIEVQTTEWKKGISIGWKWRSQGMPTLTSFNARKGPSLASMGTRCWFQSCIVKTAVIMGATLGFEPGRQQHMWPMPSVIAPSFIPSHPAHQWEKWWMSGLLKARGALMAWAVLRTYVTYSVWISGFFCW